MKPETSSGFVAFTARFEGVCPWMYLDIEGLVTCAIGNLVDSVAAAQACPWIWPSTGAVADAADVATEWHRVKSLQGMKLRGGGAFASVTNLRLTKEGVAQVVNGKVAQQWSYLVARYVSHGVNVEDLPWQAQTALLSMSWAEGPAFHAPKFDAALAAGDWEKCAVECHLEDSHNPGLRPRNTANNALFLSIAAPTETSYSSPVTADNLPVFLLPEMP